MPGENCNARSIFTTLFEGLEGLRTRIIYDSRQAVISFIFHHVVPFYHSKGKRVNFVVHSELATRKLGIVTREMITEDGNNNSSLVEAINNLRIFKIGSRKEIPSGTLGGFIKLRDNRLFEWLSETLNEFDKNDVVFLLGFYTMHIFHRDILPSFLDLFEDISSDLTLIMPQPVGVLDTHSDRIMGKLFDIDIIIKRIEDYFEEAYLIQPDQTIITGLNFYGKAKRLPDGRFEWV